MITLQILAKLNVKMRKLRVKVSIPWGKRSVRPPWLRMGDLTHDGGGLGFSSDPRWGRIGMNEDPPFSRQQDHHGWNSPPTRLYGKVWTKRILKNQEMRLNCRNGKDGQAFAFLGEWVNLWATWLLEHCLAMPIRVVCRRRLGEGVTWQGEMWGQRGPGWRPARPAGRWRSASPSPCSTSSLSPFSSSLNPSSTVLSHLSVHMMSSSEKFRLWLMLCWFIIWLFSELKALQQNTQKSKKSLQ